MSDTILITIYRVLFLVPVLGLCFFMFFGIYVIMRNGLNKKFDIIFSLISFVIFAAFIFLGINSFSSFLSNV